MNTIRQSLKFILRRAYVNARFQPIAQQSNTAPAAFKQVAIDETNTEIRTDQFKKVPTEPISAPSDANQSEKGMEEMAKDHFLLLISRQDKCLTHIGDHKATWTLMEDVAYSSTRFVELNSELGDKFCRIGIASSLLRLFLEFEPDRFERLVASRQALAIPALELISATQFNCPFNDFMKVLSFLTLLKERHNLTFSCFTPGMLHEAIQKSYIVSMEELMHIMTIVFRLSPENFGTFLNIFNKRYADILLEPTFPVIDFAIFCYFLTQKQVTNGQWLDKIAKRMMCRIRVNLHRLDLDSIGMICYFFNFYNYKNPKIRFQTAALKRMEEEVTEFSDFARKNIEIFANSYSS